MRGSIKILTIALYCALSYSSIAQSIRKPWREMTAVEREAYITAINSLPASVPQTLASEHDRLAMLFGMQNQHIHNSNIFLPWHRVFLLYFEEQLKAIDPNIAVPYWDWTEDWSSSADIFENGSGGNTGLFGFDVNGSVWEDPSTGAKFVREFDSTEPQPTNTGLTNIVNISDFGQHRAALETGPHNTGHRFVGEGNGIAPWGTMATMFSPADPIFYLHHSMVDKVWEDWVELNWTGGLLPFNNDSDSESDMLTFIGYEGSTNASNVVRENPNDWVDSKDIKVWYAEDGQVSLNDYTTSGAETYRYTGTINLENGFLVASATDCNVLSGSSVFLKSGFTAGSGSAFLVTINLSSFGRMSTNTDAITQSLRKIHDPLLEASLRASRNTGHSGRPFNIYGIRTSEQLSDQKIVSFYPNPSSGEFFVELMSDDRYSVKVFDLAGRDVQADISPLSGTRRHVRLKNDATGYYLVQIVTEKGKYYYHKIFLR